MERAAYNERLFSGGLRSFFHTARFRWVAEQVHRLGISTSSVFELGCNDGRLLDYIKVGRYIGVDADWEGGIAMAKSRRRSGVEFIKAHTAAEVPGETYDLAVSMETLEHLPDDVLDGYLAFIASHLDGYFVVTVPNEKGPLFFLKWAIKRLLTRDDGTPFSLREVFYCTIGQCSKVQRDNHKGFDYDALLRKLSERFDIVTVDGHPMHLPNWMCFSVGIVAKSPSARSRTRPNPRRRIAGSVDRPA